MVILEKKNLFKLRFVLKIVLIKFNEKDI